MSKPFPDRRDILRALGATAALTALPPHGANAATTASAFSQYPFQLGVASGSPTSSAIVLWTRLAPSPLAPGGGMPAKAIAVRWVLSARPDLSLPVASGTALARPDRAHSVHVDVRRLAPNTRYWYRFFVDGIASPIGATRTLPSADATVAEARFATLCCQNYAHGYFTAYDAIVEDEPDFLIHLGDYIYETDFGVRIREHETRGPVDSLDAFRRRHALYKMDPSLARAHAAIPFFVIPDNHDATIDGAPEMRQLRAAAYRAWQEHMPVRDFLRDDGGANIAQSIDIGDLLHIELLDTRQFRDRQDVCADGARAEMGFGNFRLPCPPMLDPQRSMLGLAQEARLRSAFLRTPRIWNGLASTVPFAPYVIADGPQRRAYVATWDGYPAARQRLMADLDRAGIGNLVVLSGDVHSSWVMDLQRRAGDPDSTYGTEIVATSVSADCPPPLAAPMVASLSHNPHVRFHDVEKRGYVLHKVDRAGWRSDLRAVEDVKRAGSSVSSLKRIAIRAGRPGVADIA